MFCDPCIKAAEFALAGDDKKSEKHHKQCRGHQWCYCQHRIGNWLTPEAQSEQEKQYGNGS